MDSSFKRRGVGAAIALALLTACAGAANGGVPAGGSSTQTASVRDGGATYPNLSGEYAGKFVDNAYGKGKGSAIYAQYQNAFGGQLTIKYPSQTLAASVSQIYSGGSGGSVTGSTAGGAGSLYCTFSTAANYDVSTHVLSGSFTAVHGCAGETGTFSMKHLCTFKGTTHEDIRPNNGPRPC